MSEWTDIGQQLRETREKKGLDLRDVAHSTRIPLSTLEALEDSDYSIFPSPTYARSFLAQYSEFLDVDAHDWIDAFETGDVLSSINDHGYLQDDHDHIGHSAPRTPASSTKRSSSSRSHEEKPSGGGTSILQTLTVFVVTAALIAGGIYAYKKYEPMLSGSVEDETVTPNQQEQSEPASDNPAATTSGQSSGTEPPTVATASGNSETAEPSSGSPDQPDTNPEVAATPTPPTPAVPKPRTGPPPKAMVIEEEDE